ELVWGIGGDAPSSPKYAGKERDYQCTAQEAELLPCGREHKVGVRCEHQTRVDKRAMEQTSAVDPSGADGQPRLVRVEADGRPARVGVSEGGKPLLLVAVQDVPVDDQHNAAD